MQTKHYKDIYVKPPIPKPPIPGKELGELAIMGWDFMVDENHRTWMIEANAYATLKHNPKNSIDTANKKQLAEDIYSLLIAPIMDGVAPNPGRLRQVI